MVVYIRENTHITPMSCTIYVPAELPDIRLLLRNSSSNFSSRMDKADILWLHDTHNKYTYRVYLRW